MYFTNYEDYFFASEDKTPLPLYLPATKGEESRRGQKIYYFSKYEAVFTP